MSTQLEDAEPHERIGAVSDHVADAKDDETRFDRIMMYFGLAILVPAVTVDYYLDEAMKAGWSTLRNLLYAFLSYVVLTIVVTGIASVGYTIIATVYYAVKARASRDAALAVTAVLTLGGFWLMWRFMAWSVKAREEARKDAHITWVDEEEMEEATADD